MTISFTTTLSSKLVTVHDVGNGSKVGDYVFFDKVTGLTGVNMNALLEAETFYVESLISDDAYTIELSSPATGNNATAGQSEAFYLLESGIDDAVLGPGWGAGPWGRLTWGSQVSSVVGEQIRLWSVDNFGQDLIACVYDGELYYWRYYGENTFPRLFLLSTIFGATSSEIPNIARFVATSDIDRHCLAFATNTIGSSVQDKLLIRWSNQEDPVDWNPTASNTAGDLRLSKGTEIVAITQTRKEILVWTDRSLHTVQFVGPPYTFAQALIADNIRMSGPNSVIAVNDIVYWMGYENFYAYDGRVQVIPCTVRNYVFSDINRSQLQKIYAGTIVQQNEVWWFYPSEDSLENDRYVVFNYAEKVWYTGNLSRTAIIDASSSSRIYPQATSSDGYLYDQERGLDDGSTDPASPISAYIESSDFDLGEGDNFMLTRRIIPDLTFTGSEASSPSADFAIKVRNYPGQSYSEDVNGSATRTATSPVEQFTDQIFLRARGRSAAVKISSNALGVNWRLGAPRLDMRPDGKR
tara:strand:- start:1193 stop:2764 length:1572 start_codon:yes stop_codon:yes gene_type:complete